MGEGPRLQAVREKLEAARGRRGGWRDEEESVTASPAPDLLEEWRAQRASRQPSLDWELFDGAGERRWREPPAERPTVSGAAFSASDNSSSLQERIARVLAAASALVNTSAAPPPPPPPPATRLWPDDWRTLPAAAEEDEGTAEEEDLLAAWRRRRGGPGWSTVDASHVWEEAVPSSQVSSPLRDAAPVSPRLRVSFAPPPHPHLAPGEAVSDEDGDVSALLAGTVAGFFSKPSTEPEQPASQPAPTSRPARPPPRPSTEDSDDAVIEELKARIAACRAELHDFRT